MLSAPRFFDRVLCQCLVLALIHQLSAYPPQADGSKPEEAVKVATMIYYVMLTSIAGMFLRLFAVMVPTWWRFHLLAKVLLLHIPKLARHRARLRHHEIKRLENLVKQRSREKHGHFAGFLHHAGLREQYEQDIRDEGFEELDDLVQLQLKDEADADAARASAAPAASARRPSIAGPITAKATERRVYALGSAVHVKIPEGKCKCLLRCCCCQQKQLGAVTKIHVAQSAHFFFKSKQNAIKEAHDCLEHNFQTLTFKMDKELACKRPTTLRQGGIEGSFRSERLVNNDTRLVVTVALPKDSSAGFNDQEMVTMNGGDVGIPVSVLDENDVPFDEENDPSVHRNQQLLKAKWKKMNQKQKAPFEELAKATEEHEGTYDVRVWSFSTTIARSHFCRWIPTLHNQMNIDDLASSVDVKHLPAEALSRAEVDALAARLKMPPLDRMRLHKCLAKESRRLVASVGGHKKLNRAFAKLRGKARVARAFIGGTLAERRSREKHKRRRTFALKSARNKLNMIRLMGQKQDDVWVLRQKIKKDPENHELKRQLAELLAAKGNHRAALSHRKTVARKDPTNPAVHAELGEALANVGDVDGAADAFSQAATLDPDNPEAHAVLGEALISAGDLAGAAEAHLKAVELDPNPTALVSLGSVLCDVGNFSQAHKHHNEALKKDPNNVAARSALGATMAAEGDLAGALAETRKALKLDPDNAGALSTHGHVLCLQGDYGGAEEAHRKAIERDRRNSDAHTNLGATLVSRLEEQAGGRKGRTTLTPAEEQQLEHALRSHETALAIAPRSYRTHQNMGKALTLKRNFKGAVESHREAIKYNPKRADVHYELGITLRKSKLPGHYDDAVASFKDAWAATLENGNGKTKRALDYSRDLARARTAADKAKKRARAKVKKRETTKLLKVKGAVNAARITKRSSSTRSKVKLQAAYSAIDVNGDGELDESEFVAACAPAGADQDEQCRRLFAMLDEDHSGSVDFRELDHALRHNPEAMALARHFDKLHDLVEVAAARRESKRRSSRRRSSRRRTAKVSEVERMDTMFSEADAAAKASSSGDGSGAAAQQMKTEDGGRRRNSLSRKTTMLHPSKKKAAPEGEDSDERKERERKERRDRAHQRRQSHRESMRKSRTRRSHHHHHHRTSTDDTLENADDGDHAHRKKRGKKHAVTQKKGERRTTIARRKESLIAMDIALKGRAGMGAISEETESEIAGETT